MSKWSLFATEHEPGVLIVVPLQNISTLADERVRADLEGILAEMEARNDRFVVIDFERVSYFGTSMLAAMQKIWTRLRDRSGRLVICNTSEVSREVLRLTHFDAIWPVCQTRQEAIETALRAP